MESHDAILAAVLIALSLTANTNAEPATTPVSDVLTTSGQEDMRQVAKQFRGKGIEAVEDK